MKLNKFFKNKIHEIRNDESTLFDDDGVPIDIVTGGAGTTNSGGALTLTLAQIQEQILALDAQLVASGLVEGTPAYVAAQEQARAEFIAYANDTPAINFSQADFAEAVGLTPDEAIAQYYNYNFDGTTALGLGYGTTVTTAVGNYNPNNSGTADGSASVFGDTTASWVPPATTLADVQVPTGYDLMDAATLEKYLPTDSTRRVQDVTQNTPAYTAANLLPATLFDAINFPEKDITRGSPAVTRGLDADGKPTTAITMGDTTASGSGTTIGDLTTEVILPSGGMGINADGTGGNVVGTLDTTGNIIDTDANKITLASNDATATSTVDATVIGGNEDLTCPIVDGVQYVRNEAGTCVKPKVEVVKVVVANTPNNIQCWNEAGVAVTITGTLDAEGAAIPESEISCPAQYPLRQQPNDDSCPIVDGVQQIRVNNVCKTPILAACKIVDGVQYVRDSVTGDCVAPETTITCYPDNGGASFAVTAQNPSCPTGSSVTPPDDDPLTTTITCYPTDGTDSFTVTEANPSCPTGSSLTPPDDDEVTTEIACYSEDGTIETVSGVNPSCPTGTQRTAPTTITCYSQADGSATTVMGFTPVCPLGTSTEAPVETSLVCYYPTGSSTTVTALNPVCPAGSSTEQPSLDEVKTANIQAIVNGLDAELVAGAVAGETSAQFEARKAEAMEKGKVALANYAGEVEGGLTVELLANAASASNATTLLDLDATQGSGLAGIDVSQTDIMKTIQNEYSQDGNFGVVDNNAIYYDTLTGNTAQQDLDIAAGEATLGDFGRDPSINASSALANQAAATSTGMLNAADATDTQISLLANQLNAGNLNVDEVATTYNLQPDQVTTALGQINSLNNTDTTSLSPLSATKLAADQPLLTSLGPLDQRAATAAATKLAADKVIADKLAADKVIADAEAAGAKAKADLSNLNIGNIGNMGFGGEGFGSFDVFAEGGPVTDPMQQRQDAVGSRLMRQTGIGSLQEKTMSPEMASTLDRIMARRK